MATTGKRQKSKRTRNIVITAFIIVVAVAAFFVYRALSADASAEVTYTTGTVEKMTLTSSISGVGNMELSTSATVTPSVSGEVSGLSVAEGDTVVEGQVLFTIVNPELDIAVESAQNAYDKAVLAVASAELSVLQAEQSLSDLYEQYEEQSTSTTTSQTTGTLPSTTTTAPPTTTTQPSTTTTQPSTTTTDPYTTTSEPAASTTQTVSASADDAVLLAAAATSQSGGQTSSEITYLDIQAAKQAIESAELSVTSANTELESAELALEQAQENAANRQVTAPISGTITSLSIENGDTIGSSSSSSSGGVGSQSTADASTTTSSSAAMVITDTDAFQATITLAESDIILVEVGQKAVITFDALPDLTLAAKVTEVDDSGSNSQGVVSYSVVVVPETIDASIKAGMTVSVNVITEVATDVLAVPSSAIKSSGDSKYVQVLEDGQLSNLTVETGMSTDSYTEITSGLTEGQEIVIATLTTDSESTATTERGTGSILNQGGMQGGNMQGGGMQGGSMPSGGFTPPGQ